MFRDLYRSFNRSRLFFTINVVGLTIGLALSIMLILFVFNELSFDRHFKDSDRIISLNTAWDQGGHVDIIPITTRSTVTEIPLHVPGIEAATQIYKSGNKDLTYEKEHFQNLTVFATEPSFFDVFEMEFVEGDKSVLDNPSTVILTDKYARIIFGDTQKAVGKKVTINDHDYAVGGVVKELPANTHFRFDVLSDMNYMKEWPSIEFFTFYKIAKGHSLEKVREEIEKAYTSQLTLFFEKMDIKGEGVTEKLTDIYLHTQARDTLGVQSDMKFVWLLCVVSLLILALAITNFVNLFVVQGENRMVEIGIKKANGAEKKDIIVQFFSEIGLTVLIAFILAFGLVLLILPSFAQLINRNIDVAQLGQPVFIIPMLVVFVLTVLLSASYPSFYLAKFSPIDTLMKRLRFSKKRLTSYIVVFQSLISIVLLAYIFIVNKQTSYLENSPIGYNPKGVMHIYMNNKSRQEYNTLKGELLRNPRVKGVSTAGHVFGRGASGQMVRLMNESMSQSIHEYRIYSGICELMELELVEGSFYKEDAAINSKGIILNETAVRMLGLNYPVVGTNVVYKEQVEEPLEIMGVVKDFTWTNPEEGIGPMALKFYDAVFSVLYVKFDETVSRNEARDIVEKVFHSIDAEFIVNPDWSEDIYNNKFESFRTQSEVLFYTAILAIFISMLGLLGVHTFTTIRRVKEIAVRRINGASGLSIFTLLSLDILKWVLFSGIIAAPIVYYVTTNWLNNYYNRTSIDIWIFLIPILLQLLIALITTSGVSIKVLSQNPVKSLKSE